MPCSSSVIEDQQAHDDAQTICRSMRARVEATPAERRHVGRRVLRWALSSYCGLVFSESFVPIVAAPELEHRRRAWRRTGTSALAYRRSAMKRRRVESVIPDRVFVGRSSLN